MATTFNQHPSTPSVIKFSDVSFGKLVSDVSSASQTILASAKSYTDTKTENMSTTGHTHVVNDVTDASTELATKTHTHSSSDLTDLAALTGSFIRAYTTEELATVQMNDGDSFVYFDLTTKKLCRVTKTGEETTTTEFGVLSAINE